jgi:subtilisin family serine protease
MVRSGRSRAVRLVLALSLAVAIQASLVAGATAASGAERSFIVMLKPGVVSSLIAGEHADRLGARVTHVYRHALQGYAARLSAPALARVLLDPRVASVVPDGIVRADTTQTNPTWGLDRIDQRNLPLSGTFTYTNTGSGVTAYILDTGIRISHQEFGGRASDGFDAVDGSLPAADCNGHGTHVAGTVGGSTYGVAKGVTLVAVRVLGCDGSAPTSTVIAGVDWVTGDHASGERAVANMSLSGGGNSAMDTAVANSIADGVAYAVAAGNASGLFGQPTTACSRSPARLAQAMTISATNRNDAKASFANYGSCVDWFAPGVDVQSAWNSSDTSTNTISGTSMATPHTAGVAALYLQTTNATPQQVRDALYALSTKDIVKNSRTSAHNDLLFTNL